VTTADRKIAARRLIDAKRVVVKVGSALLVDAEKGRLNRSWLEAFAADVASIRKRGQEIWCRRGPLPWAAGTSP
jgi:glutamate 5-kinase